MAAFLWYNFQTKCSRVTSDDGQLMQNIIFANSDPLVTIIERKVQWPTVLVIWRRNNGGSLTIVHYFGYTAHDDVIKWKHFPCHWFFVRGIHRYRWIPLTKARDAELWCLSLICAWINGWVNNREAGELRRHRAHNYVIVINHIDRFTPINHSDGENDIIREN